MSKKIFCTCANFHVFVIYVSPKLGLTSSTCVNLTYVDTWKFVTLQPCASTDAECDQEVFKEYEACGIGEDGKVLVADLEVGDDVCVQVHPSPRYPKGDNFGYFNVFNLLAHN